MKYATAKKFKDSLRCFHCNEVLSFPNSDENVKSIYGKVIRVCLCKKTKLEKHFYNSRSKEYEGTYVYTYSDGKNTLEVGFSKYKNYTPEWANISQFNYIGDISKPFYKQLYCGRKIPKFAAGTKEEFYKGIENILLLESFK